MEKKIPLLVSQRRTDCLNLRSKNGLPIGNHKVYGIYYTYNNMKKKIANCFKSPLKTRVGSFKLYRMTVL